MSPAADVSAGPGAAAPKSIAAAALTALFVPGDRPERFAKAAGSGCDLVIIDLEDAVGPEAKDAARANALSALSATGPALTALVRLNAPGTDWAGADIAEIAALAHVSGSGVLGVVLAKAEDPDAVDAVARLLPDGATVIPLIESARGVVAARAIAAVRGVTRLALGAVDLSIDLGVGDDPRALDHARSELVLASRAAELAAPLDSPPTAIRDLESVAASARHGRMLGFGGSLCIHPAQLGPVRDAYRPTPAEVQWAETVLDNSADGAVQVNGAMVDRPVIERARRILARSAAMLP